MNLMSNPTNSPTSSPTSSLTNLKSPTISPISKNSLTSSPTNLKNSTSFNEPNEISHERMCDCFRHTRKFKEGLRVFRLCGEKWIEYQRELMHCVSGGDEETPYI
ncbi:hypothetical protein Bca4012_025552 [Brassica carinata]